MNTSSRLIRAMPANTDVARSMQAVASSTGISEIMASVYIEHCLACGFMREFSHRNKRGERLFLLTERGLALRTRALRAARKEAARG